MLSVSVNEGGVTSAPVTKKDVINSTRRGVVSELAVVVKV